jgi:steroid delta-isomerase-like uncharacterized protein
VTEKERVVRQFYDAFNAGDVERAAAEYAEKCEWEFPAFGRVCRTREEVLDVCRSWRTAFPDGRVEIANVIACDDVVIVEWDSHGTWTGPLGGGRDDQPNGRRFQRRGCAVTEVEDGKIVRCRDYFDRANMYEPLGLMHVLAG